METRSGEAVSVHSTEAGERSFDPSDGETRRLVKLLRLHSMKLFLNPPNSCGNEEKLLCLKRHCFEMRESTPSICYFSTSRLTFANYAYIYLMNVISINACSCVCVCAFGSVDEYGCARVSFQHHFNQGFSIGNVFEITSLLEYMVKVGDEPINSTLIHLPEGY